MNEDLAPDQPVFGLRHYLDVIWRRKLTLLAVMVACVGAALLFTLTQSKTYEATIRIVVGQGNSLFAPQTASAIQPFTLTMQKLVKSNVVAENVISNLRLEGETPQHLLSKVSVSVDPDTAVLDVSVLDHEKQRATRIAQEFGLVFAQLVKEQFGTLPTEGTGPTQLPLTAKIFDPAHVDPYPISPRPVRNLAVSIVLGFLLGLLAAFLREFLDRRLRSREDVERSFGTPVIGQIPFARTGGRDKRGLVVSGEMAEAFRALRANLQYLGVKGPLRTILITSAAPEQGKTTVAANLALAIARSGASVVVVEGDLRRPRLDDAFDLTESGPGLTSVLVGASELGDAIRTVPVPGVSDGTEGELALLPSGPLPPNPSELLSSFQMRDLLDRLSRTHDYVLIDSPPLLSVADTLELARMVDGVVLVVRRNRASTDEGREVQALIERLEIHLVGAVFTDVGSLGGYGYGYGETPQRNGKARMPRKPAPEPKLEPAPVATEGDAHSREDF